MRKNPIERAEKFHLGKRRQTWEGPAHKKQLYTVIFFRALSLTLPFHYLCSSTKLRYCIYLPYLLCHYIAIVHIRPERKRERESSTLPTFFSFGQSPCSCWTEKRSAWMSNCPQNTMKDWFAALFRALTLLGGELNRKPVSQGWNKDVLSAGKEGKTAHLAPVHQARKIGRRGKNTEDCDYMEKKRAHIYSSKRRHNTEWGWRGSEHPWILNRLPQQGLEKVNHVKAALHFFCMRTKL